MLFVVNNSFTSSQLRGEHLAAALGVRCHFGDVGGVRDDVIVFVKDSDRGLVEDAKERRNRIVYDPLDQFCYKDRTVTFGDLVDVVLVPNREAAEFYAPTFPKAKYAIVPHQWDARITASAPQDKMRPGYIGKPFNCPPDWRGDRVTLSPEMLAAAPLFNLHLSCNQRNDKSASLKPATKIATAAAVLANVVSYPDPSATELLGDDYPYLVEAAETASDVVRRAYREFGGPRWRLARDKMRAVRERLSIKAIAELYKRLDDESWLIQGSAQRMAA